MVGERSVEIWLKRAIRGAPLLLALILTVGCNCKEECHGTGDDEVCTMDCAAQPTGDPDAIPRVSAGPDRTVEVGAIVELNGTTNGNTATHKWELVSQPLGTPSVIQDAYQLAGATFIADREGDYVVKLIGATSSNLEAPDVNPATTDEATITAIVVEGSGGVPGCGDLIDSFGDGDFADGDWGWEVVAERSRNYDPPVVTDPMDGGHPGAYRNVEMTVSASAEQSGGIWVAHNLIAAEYTPETDGEVCGIRMFLDGTDQFNLLEAHQAIFSVFLFQNDTYYWGERLFVNEEMWTTGDWPIDDPGNPGTSFGFQKFAGDGPDEPDLATGSAIQFGFLTGASRPVSAPGTGTNYSGADNFRVELYAPLSE
jgi:hypothetical protein